MAESPEALFERFRARADTEALGALFDRLAPELFRTAVHLVSDPTVAEELLQETFVTAIERRDQYDANRRLVPWLVGILTNHARRAWRTSARRPDPGRLTEREAHLQPQDAPKLDPEVIRAIGRLPAPYREVVVLHMQYGMSPADIAHSVDRSPSTVRTQIQRGLAKVRKQLATDLHVAVGVPAVTGLGLTSIRARVVARAQDAMAGDLAVAATATWGGITVAQSKAMAALLIAALLLTAVVYTASIPTPPEAARVSTVPADPLAGDDTAAGGPGLSGGRATTDGDARPERAAIAAAKDTWRLTGIARDFRTRKALPHAKVTAEFTRGDVRTGQRSAICDAAGRYVIALDAWELESDLVRRSTRVQLRASAPGYLGGASGVTVLPASVATDFEMDVELAPGVPVRGRVLDSAGSPVQGATVTLYGPLPSDRAGYVVRTDAEGKYITGIFGRPEQFSPFRLVAQADQGYAMSQVLEVESVAPLDVQDLVLHAVGFASGRVERPDGRPIPGIKVRAAPPEGEAPEEMPYGLEFHKTAATTGEDGRFRVPIHRSGQVTLSLHGVLGARLMAEHEVSAGDEDVRIVSDIRLLTVHVRDPNGEPVPGVPVALRGFHAADAHLMELLKDGLYSFNDVKPRMSIHGEGTTDRHGRYIAWLPTGAALWTTAHPPGMVPAEGFVLMPSDEEASRDIDLTLRPHAGGTCGLQVQLAGADGRALFPIEIALLTATGLTIQKHRLNEVKVLEGLPAGPFTVRVRPLPTRGTECYECMPAWRRVVLEEGKVAHVAVKAVRPGRVALTLHAGPSDEVRGVQLGVRPTGQERLPWTSLGSWRDPEGRTHNASGAMPPGVLLTCERKLAPGAYSLRAVFDESNIVEREIVVPHGGVAHEIVDVGR